jgi:dolichyl-phosphate beta-glucosyltransferase
LISLILPAYNEVKRIANSITHAAEYFDERGHAYQIIVAADGRDGTREAAAAVARLNPAITVMGSDKRGGKGLGIRLAVRQAQGSIIGFSDADEKTPIDELDKFLPLLSQDWDVVIGSRAALGARIEQPQPLHRRLGSKGFAVFMHAVLGLRDIEDTQCGFKFFKRHAALDLFGRQYINGYMVDVEILYLAQQSGYRIAQVPIRWRDDGDSRLQLVQGTIRCGLDVLTIPFVHRTIRRIQ